MIVSGYSYTCTVILHRNYDEDQQYSSYEISRSGTAGVQQGATYYVYVPIPATQIYTRPGYNFVGYGLYDDSTIPSFQPGDSVTFAQNRGGSFNVHLYCIWERVAMADLSSVSSPVTIGASPGGTASWNIPDPSFVYELKLTCGSAPAVTYNIAANTASKSFDIPNTWLSYLVNATSATATATLTTKDGTTVMGTSTKTFTVEVDSSVEPTLSVAPAQVSTNATVNSWGKYVQGFSKVKLTATAAAGTGATISSYSFNGPNLSYTGTDAEKTSGVIDASGSISFTVTVTDSRGRQATETVTVSFEPYSIPVVSGIDTNRCAADGTTDNAGGGYLKITPHYSISSVDGSNSIAAQALYYRENGTANWTTLVDPCASNTAYSKPTYDWPVSLSKAYDVRCVVTDALGSTRDYVTTLPGAGGIWYGRTNDRLGLGIVPPGPGLYCGWDTKYLKTLDVVPRRCSKQITSSGWFRVLAYEAGNLAEAQGAVGFVVDLTIGKDGIGSEAHKVSLFGVYGHVGFKAETSVSATQYIDKIRYTYETSSPNNGYVDIHLISNPQSVITADFIVNTKPVYQGLFVAEELESVNDSPSGETVLSEYVLSANT